MKPSKLNSLVSINMCFYSNVLSSVLKHSHCKYAEKINRLFGMSTSGRFHPLYFVILGVAGQ